MAKKLYDEYEEEIELEEEVKGEEEEVAEIHLPKEEKKSGEKKDRKWLNRILSLILGFFIGVFSVWGTVAAVVCFVLFQPLDNTIGVIDGLTGGNFYETMFGETDANGNVIKAGILDEKYAELKIKDLLGDSIDAIQQLSGENASLSPLNEISPKVGSTLDSLIKTLEKYGISMDRDELLEAPFKSNGDENQKTITEYIKTALMETPAGDFFTAFSKNMSPILKALCYGEEGVDFVEGADGTVTMLNGAQKMTLGDLLGENMTDALDRVPIETVMTIDLSDSMMCSLAYGNDNRYTVSEGVVTMNQVLYTLTETEDGVVFLDDNDQVVEGSVEQLSDDLYRLTVPTGNEDNPVQIQYVAVEGNVGKAYKNAEKTLPLLYEKTRIGDLRDDARSVVDNILLCDAMDIKADDNRILIAIAYGNDYEIVGDEIVCDNPRTIGQLRSSKGSFMKDIPLTAVLTEERSNGVTMYMLYGKSGIHYDIDVENNIQFRERIIAVLKDENNEYRAYNEYGEALTAQKGVEGEEGYVAGYVLSFSGKTYTDSTGHEYTLVNARTTLETKDGEADVYYLRETDGSKVYYSEHTLRDLDGSDNLITSINSRLTIGELMDAKDIENNKFLKHVKNYTIEELPNALEELYVNDVYADEIYDDNGEIQGAWRYLLCTYENGVLVEQKYTLNYLDPLIDNMQENIHQTTLYTLAEDGMINFSQDTLDHEIKTSIYSSEKGGYVDIELAFLEGKTCIGELTLDQMIQYTDTIVQLI